MVTTELKFRLFSHGHLPARLGESPCVDVDGEAVWWVDVDGKKLFRTSCATGETLTWETPEFPGFVVMTAAGYPAVGMQTGIFAFLSGTGRFEMLVGLDMPGCRFNDATVDANGRLWASTMALDAQRGRAAIHLVNSMHGFHTVVDGLAIPNGLAVDAARQRLYYSDSHRSVQSIWVLPTDDVPGVVGEEEPFATTLKLAGRPDGAALDADGNYWIAGVDGAEIYVFEPEGQMKSTLAVPCPEPTKLCFAGDDLRTVLLTSKGNGETGGCLIRAFLPPGMAPGVAQHNWAAGPLPLRAISRAS